MPNRPRETASRSLHPFISASAASGSGSPGAGRWQRGEGETWPSGNGPLDNVSTLMPSMISTIQMEFLDGYWLLCFGLVLFPCLFLCFVYWFGLFAGLVWFVFCCLVWLVCQFVCLSVVGLFVCLLLFACLLVDLLSLCVCYVFLSLHTDRCSKKLNSFVYFNIFQ